MSPEEFVWWIKGLLELGELNEDAKSLVQENVDVVIGEIRKSKEKFTFTSSSAAGISRASGAYMPPVYFSNNVIATT